MHGKTGLSNLLKSICQIGAITGFVGLLLLIAFAILENKTVLLLSFIFCAMCMFNYALLQSIINLDRFLFFCYKRYREIKPIEEVEYIDKEYLTCIFNRIKPVYEDWKLIFVDKPWKSIRNNEEGWFTVGQSNRITCEITIAFNKEKIPWKDGIYLIHTLIHECSHAIKQFSKHDIIDAIQYIHYKLRLQIDNEDIEYCKEKIRQEISIT